ncbi:MAG: BofC C-terminal domain-containing protein [Lachnospiraceae bacterium]|nr:BofC C-terminal domain-containing protein [Lachnospiraceae bacterium]
MKRIGVYLFFMAALLCLAYGFSFYMYENKQKELAEQEEQEEVDVGGSDTAASATAGGDAQPDSDGKETFSEEEKAQETGASSTPSFWQYVMKYENEKIVVYQKDGETVYEETDIDKSHLSEDVLKQLKEGIMVSDEEELYSLLESFSS